MYLMKAFLASLLTISKSIGHASTQAPHPLHRFKFILSDSYFYYFFHVHFLHEVFQPVDAVVDLTETVVLVLEYSCCFIVADDIGDCQELSRVQVLRLFISNLSNNK